jgi:chromosomal replication initiation ATPase DnaA
MYEKIILIGGCGMNSFDEVFEQVKQYLLVNGIVADVAFKTWITPLIPKELDGQDAIFEVETVFQQGVIFKNYKEKIEQALEAVTGIQLNLVINVCPQKAAPAPEVADASASIDIDHDATPYD